MTIYQMQMALANRATSQDELNRGALAAQQQNAQQQAAVRFMLAAYHGYERLRCSRCGDEVMSAKGVVEEEIAHALKGCNGSLYEVPL